MLDFETVYRKHGENFLWNVLDNWERHHRISHTRMLTLEERWELFVRVTAPIAA